MYTVVLLATPLVITAPALKGGPGIVGEWAVESQLTGGGVQPYTEPTRLRFVFTADGKWAMYFEGSPVVPTAKYTLSFKTRPYTIDLGRESDRSAFEGVFKMEGDILTICHSVGAHPRATRFTVSDDDSVSLFVLRRVK